MFVTFRIFIMCEHSDFAFHTQIDRSESQSTDDKVSLKGMLLRHVTHFKF